MTTNGGRRVASFYFYEDLVAGTGETFMMPLGRIEEGDIIEVDFDLYGNSQWGHARFHIQGIISGSTRSPRVVKSEGDRASKCGD